jgi:predicted SprT family Zn-dependent metalloprotease
MDKARELKAYAKERMDLFKLDDWEFDWDYAVQRFGCCYHERKKITISLSLLQINNIEVLKNTVNHEIAHALAGREACHGPAWKAKCLVTGAKPERCCQAGIITGKYKGLCSICPFTCYKQKMPKHAGTWRHSGCKGKISFTLN